MDVIIIGSGWAGICTMKHCLEENIRAIVLEKNDDYGGIWNVHNSPSVYANTYSVTSKYYLSMSDFPMPKSYPEFPHHTLVMEYMKMYARHFDVEKHISLNSEVIKVTKNDDLWHVEYKYNNEIRLLVSKNIAICTGQNSSCKNYPDIDTSQFKGKIYHADDYNDLVKNECLNKKILIYGGSDTAFDIGVELTNNLYSKVKENGKVHFGYSGSNGTIRSEKTMVYISMKKGRWIQRRTTGTYDAADMFYSRFVDNLFKNTSKSLASVFTPFLETMWGKSGSGVPEWQTNAGYLNSYYVKSADILPKITFGDIIPLRDISQINDTSIITIDNKKYDIDIIIFATGYAGFSCYTFLPNTLLTGKYYDHIFLIDDSSVAKVGFIRPFLTSIPMIIEMQSRYVAKVFAKKIHLPKHSMSTDYEKMKQQQSIEFEYDYERVQGIIDPYDYMNMIASKINVSPNLFMLSDPLLLYFILFHTWSHFVYRLNDPETSKLARDEIIGLNKNGQSNKIFLLSNLIFILLLFIIILFIRYNFLTS